MIFDSNPEPKNCAQKKHRKSKMSNILPHYPCPFSAKPYPCLFSYLCPSEERGTLSLENRNLIIRNLLSQTNCVNVLRTFLFFWQVNMKVTAADIWMGKKIKHINI